MNKLGLLATGLVAVLITLNAVAQSSIEKKVIATLGPGETLANGENCFMLKQNPESISFVTVVKSESEKQYYCYGKDGNKVGPVKEPNVAYWAECADNVIDNCVVNNEPNMDGYEKYISSDGSITYQGKTYGPYGQLILFNISKDEQFICAIALTTAMKMLYFDNTGRKVDITGMPEEIILSPDGKTSFVKVKGSLNPFDPEALQKMIDNPEETNNPKVFIYGIDGSKYGPFSAASFSDTWFTPSGQWIMYADSEIYLNGKVLFKVDDYVSKCDIWINKTGDDYAYANYEKIIFRNGTTFTAPLAIESVIENGKGYLKWLALENGKELVFYKKPF
jgi:hypothetical protein